MRDTAGMLTAVADISGTVSKGFEAVADTFAANFDERGEVGACVCAYLDGRPVVDLWGGVADPTTGRPWEEDTIVGVFSSTKGVTATGANLAIERGLLDPDEPVATYWPEFAAAGKEAVTVGQALSHRAGVPLVEGAFTMDDLLAWDPIVEALAAQAPLWEPGTKHGYHMRTFGWLAGELLRRTTGRSAGTFLREEVLEPVGADFWVGLPEELEPRVARLIPPKESLAKALEAFGDTLLLARVFDNPGHLFDYDESWNDRPLHEVELPSSNGIGNARALARMYASLVGDGLDGYRTLRPETVAAATVERSAGPDEVIMVESRFGLGYMLGTAFGLSNPPSCFGHAGAGGSISFADPDSGLAFAYVPNDLRFDTSGDPRSDLLVRAVRQAVEGSENVIPS